MTYIEKYCDMPGNGGGDDDNDKTGKDTPKKSDGN